MSPSSSKKSAFVAIIRRSIRERSWQFAGIFIALLVMGLAQGLLLFLIGPFLKAVLSLSSKESHVVVRDLLPEQTNAWVSIGPGTIVAASTLVFAVPVAVVVVGMVRALANYIYQRCQAKIALTVAKNIRHKLFEAVLQQRYEILVQKSAAGWMSLIMNDVFYLQMRFSEILTVLLKDSVLIVSALLAMTFIHWQSALVIMALSPVLVLSLGRGSQRIAFYANFWQLELGKLASVVLDIRSRFAFIRAQGGEQLEAKRFREANEAYYRSIRKSIFLRSVFAPGVEFLGFAMLAGFVWVVGKGQWGKEFSSATMLQFFAALGLMVKPLKEVGEQLARYSEVKGSLSECVKILEDQSTIDVPVNIATSLGKAAPKLTGCVISSVETRYGSSQGISGDGLLLKSGKTVAVIGPSGGGKTTLLKTIAGLVTAYSWQADIEQPELAKQISLVSQIPFLFKATVDENLCYGLGTRIDKDLQRHLLQTFDLSDVDLQQQFDPLNPNLSGGQVQRLVVVRALLRRKPILLLDEAASALDELNENRLIDTILSWAKETRIAVCSVTHRLGRLQEFDEIWFIDSGKVAAKGTYGQIMTQANVAKFCQVEDLL